MSELSDELIDSLGFDQADLVKLANWPMPFGKYQGRVIIDLPEEYLFWFAKHEFPEGKLGDLMQLCLAIKIEGLDGLIRPLINNSGLEASSNPSKRGNSEA